MTDALYKLVQVLILILTSAGCSALNWHVNLLAGFLSFVLGPMKRSKKLFRKYAVTLFEPLIGFVAYMLGRSFALPAFKVSNAR